jgi:hypothetical protein
MFAKTSFEGVYTGIKKVMADKWYIDELYDAVIVRTIECFSRYIKICCRKKPLTVLLMAWAGL